MRGQDKLTVGILFGGRSAEHLISIRSARSVLEAIDRSRFDPVLIAIDRTGRWFLLRDETECASLETEGLDQSADEVVATRSEDGLAFLSLRRRRQETPTVDVVFPVLHGTYGEDGTLQGMLEMLDVAYVGSGVLGSAIGMDKDVQKRLLAAAGLPVVPWETVSWLDWKRNPERMRENAARLGFPLFVKPANLGSSVGVTRVNERCALDAAVEAALAYDTKTVIEHGVDAREIECSVLGNEEPRASLPGEIVPESDFYSYDAKYGAASQARLLIPAPIPAKIRDRVRDLAVRAFEITECAGMARVDFFLERGTNDIFVNELNTIPGFTSISMYPKLWEASGLSYRDLVTALVDLAMERHATRAALAVV